MNTSNEPAYELRTTPNPSAGSHHELPVTYAVRGQVENTLSPLAISDMTCVFFDDLPDVRFMAGKIMAKIGFKESSVFDTGKEFTSKCESIKANRDLKKKVLFVEEIKQRFEWRKMKNADIIITDINDTNNMDDPSGGLRRGEMALAQGKIVIFVTGNADNKTMIHSAFAEKYAGQYAFMTKPFGVGDIKETVERLIARRAES